MKHLAIALSVILVASAAVVVAHAQTPPTTRRASSYGNLLKIGQAVQMYASENKGHLPPDLGKLGRYLNNDLDVFVSPRRATQVPPDVREKPDASAEWFALRCDYVWTVPPGTRLTKIRPANQFPLVVERGTDERDAHVAILYADGHVVEYEPHVARLPAFADRAPAPRASLVPISPAPTSAPSSQPTDVPENLAAALEGSWRIVIAGTMEVTYTFQPGGTFALVFTAAEGLMPQGNASGKWRIDGSRLVMTNTASNTPNTIVGEEEDAEIVGIDAQRLALRTTDRKGVEEVLVFQRVVPFAKGKHDNPHVIGTWQGDNVMLVTAESGLLVLSAGGQTTKGQWAQRGDQLLILFDVPAPQQPRQRNPLLETPARTREVPVTIDLANETTLVLTGALLGRRDATMTLLRVK